MCDYQGTKKALVDMSEVEKDELQMTVCLAAKKQFEAELTAAETAQLKSLEKSGHANRKPNKDWLLKFEGHVRTSCADPTFENGPDENFGENSVRGRAIDRTFRR